MKNFLNLFSFSSPIRSFSTPNILSSDPADTDKIDYTHYSSAIFRTWLYDDFEYLPEQNIYSCVQKRLKYFYDKYVYVSQQKPGTKIFLSLNLRLKNGSFVEVLPLVDITDVSEEFLYWILSAHMEITSNQWEDIYSCNQVSHILTKGRLLFDDDPAYDPDNDESFLDFYPDIVHVTSLCGKYYDPKTKIFDWYGFIDWKRQSNKLS